MMSDKFVEEHEVVCDKCGGVGSVIAKYNHFRKNHTRKQCPKCKGTGKLDWLERIVGKKPEAKQALYRPILEAHFFYSGNKLFETTKDGGIKLYA